MYVKELTAKNFRSYEDLTLEFSPGINFIIGENGTGKTNILEAISVASNIKSFRNIADSEIIQWGKDSYYCSIQSEEGEYRKFEIGCVLQSDKIKKKVKINGKEVSRSSKYFGKFLTVIFSPIDINIINGAPDLRRRFFDSVISKIDYDYIIAKQNFDDSKIKQTIKKQPEITQQVSRVEVVKKQGQVKNITTSTPPKENQPQQKNRKHEGIFRNF